MLNTTALTIYDNIDERLLPALRRELERSRRADFCVGYFNLRGWKGVCAEIDRFDGGDEVCRVLVGMHMSESEELRRALSSTVEEGIDTSSAKKLRRQLATEFREQLQWGGQSNRDEAALRRLVSQLRSGKVKVSLFVSYPLHAKLYLCYPEVEGGPNIGFVGSSNLTLGGLGGRRKRQGELNVDIVEGDDCTLLAEWFDARWDDRWCIDISTTLVEIIEESWARTTPIPPYHIYLKIAWHLAHDARIGLSEFNLPKRMRNILFDYQEAAVKLAARHLQERGGVIIGDVVGLGKTLMATALALMFDEDRGYHTLIIAPKNLVGMWKEHVHEYGLRSAEVLSVTRVQSELPDLRRYHLVLIDESHNLRNREGKRYRVIRDYILRNDSKCILLTATPYNKTYLDLSNQLRLFLDEQVDLGVRPETLLSEIGEAEFAKRHNVAPRSIAAFEQSEHPDDWRDLMRLYLVRRTRSFVKQNYALAECPKCGRSTTAIESECPACGTEVDGLSRRFLEFPDGTRSYFPVRLPQNVPFTTSGADDPYARLYDEDVVDTINKLKLPRYGLAEYLRTKPTLAPTTSERGVMADLGRARTRLRGFCRTNLFKRLESSGEAFLRSIERHALRNLVVAYALSEGLPVPIGSQDAAMLDPDFGDEDRESLFEGEEVSENGPDEDNAFARRQSLAARAAAAYDNYRTRYRNQFNWLRPEFFRPGLKKHLLEDAEALTLLLDDIGEWDIRTDVKFEALHRLVTEKHPNDKILLFSQFADTIRYLDDGLRSAGVQEIAGVTGDSDDPTELAARFSPRSNHRDMRGEPELRVLLATDVLSEGQNLQDAHIVVNFDLPWALIRLVQRVGRVDRIGQQAREIRCYSFMPAEGVEKIIRLRSRVSQRLEENAEVVGSDEKFFEDSVEQLAPLVDLYNEKTGVLDGDDAEGEVDLASHAFSIWQGAVRRDPKLKEVVENLPGVVYSTKENTPSTDGPDGVLAFIRTSTDVDALVWLDRQGRPVTESPVAILKGAECEPDTPTLERTEDHHDLVNRAKELVNRGDLHLGGQLGNKREARFRCYARLEEFTRTTPIFDTPRLRRSIEAIYRHPLTESANDTLKRQMRTGIDDAALAELVATLHEDEELVVAHDDLANSEPQIICSLGLRGSQ